MISCWFRLIVSVECNYDYDWGWDVGIKEMYVIFWFFSFFDICFLVDGDIVF